MIFSWILSFRLYKTTIKKRKIHFSNCTFFHIIDISVLIIHYNLDILNLEE